MIIINWKLDKIFSVFLLSDSYSNILINWLMIDWSLTILSFGDLRHYYYQMWFKLPLQNIKKKKINFLIYGLTNLEIIFLLSFLLVNKILLALLLLTLGIYLISVAFELEIYKGWLICSIQGLTLKK